ncbi:MAG: site-2 protease family protein [Planctomycetes bacterium]|nr:site-2 protease family protein [Planctomycetota bacterium]MBI3848251.1 site-2 protease family protein [Planctomycetota bacterium]
MTIVFFAIYFFLFVMSFVVHEVAHAWVADRCGDSTARSLGRITLNPIPHIDPFRSILLPIASTLLGGYALGGAKPVPVNVAALRHPHRDDILVTLAGPFSNVAIAIFFGLLMHLPLFGEKTAENPAMLLMGMLVFTNIALAIFNLLPIPPLDGSHVIRPFLPRPVAEIYRHVGFEGYFLAVALFQIPAVSRTFASLIIGCWTSMGHSRLFLVEIYEAFLRLRPW